MPVKKPVKQAIKLLLFRCGKCLQIHVQMGLLTRSPISYSIAQLDFFYLDPVADPKQKVTANHPFAVTCIFCTNRVEVRRVELLSKHILQKPSTCLFYFIMSGSNWKQTTDHFLSCMVLSDQHSL
jgi:hypothetical protein